MENVDQLILIKQLPIIEQMLDKMSAEIDNKIDKALKLVPEKMLSGTKKIRAELNKDLSVLESARKDVKNKIMKPYLDFEEIYQEKISNKYKKADKILKDRIDSAENAIKAERTDKLKAYFNEYCNAESVTGVTFSDMPIKINISGSDKSYRDKIKSWIDKVKQDLAVINTVKDENTRLEILLDYKRDFNVNRAVLEHDRKVREIAKLKDAESVTPDGNLSAPVDNSGQNRTEPDSEIYEMTFTVKGTLEQLRSLKRYMFELQLI